MFVGLAMTTERPRGSAYLQRPARVALFSGNYNCTLDGANKTLNRLVDHLQSEAGVEVRIYSPTAPKPAFAPVGDLVSVPSFAIPLRPEYRVAMGLPRHIQRDVRAFNPDIIHLSAPDLLGSAAQSLARKLDVPVVASLHTHFESYLDYYGLGLLKPWMERRLAAFYNGCDYVLAPNPSIAEQVQRDSPAARARVWARGVEPQLFNPERRSDAWRRAHGFRDDRPVVVFLGRVVMEKGLGVFVETIEALQAARGPVQVLVIGEGPALPWFRERLPDAVFTGFLSGDALAMAIASSDIFFNPSSTETFGNVNLEAMASGLAMVCADAPNCRALVEPGRTGILCRSHDPGAYADAILFLMDDPVRRMAMGRAAHLESAAYLWPRILDQMVGVYREAMAAPRLGWRARAVGRRLLEPAYGGLTAAGPLPGE
jgi:glycosyltransferase involved in cell wall biosynthesis